ncbi:uncharacterized protein DDB_G0284459-like [Planococcus citri]|uniref:uncharacterized protein DDB_G0284459-like n=1 Tax=Planococcus citri TaxID=170843 RepID=UPI0031F782F1
MKFMIILIFVDDVNDLNKTLKDMLKAAREKKIAAGANVSTEIMNEKRSKKPSLKLKDDSDHHHTNKGKKTAKKHNLNDAEEKERKKKKNNEIRDAAAASEQSSNTEMDDDVEKKKDNATESNGNLEKDDSVGKKDVPEMTAANSDKKRDDSDKLEDDSDKNEYGNDGKSKEESSPSDDDNEDELDKDQQLFGKDHSEKMSHLCNGIYCKKFVLKMALHASTQPEHLARRLLEGVFKTENVLDCTITGRSANAQGKARQAEKTTPLHPTAVAAIISFVKSTSVTKGWQVPSEQKLKAVIGVRLGEMKRETKRAALFAKLNAD